MKGPIILIANLLTEGRGMLGFTAADAVARIEEATGRKVDVVITNVKWPSPQVLGRYAQEHKEPLAPGNAAGALRAGRRRILDRRNRPPRSPAAGVRGVERAVAAPAGRQLTDKQPQSSQRTQSNSTMYVAPRFCDLRCHRS